jgi:hypothetical protein
MHSLLEGYLSEVSTLLSKMPVSVSDDELRELRAHLTEAFDKARDRGLSDDDAAQEAVLSFGPASDLARDLMRAWRRGQVRQNAVAFLGAVGCFYLANSVATDIFKGLMIGWLSHPHMLPTVWEGPIMMACAGILIGVAAAMTGYVFARQAWPATFAALAVILSPLAGDLLAVVVQGRGSVPAGFSPVAVICSTGAEALIAGVITALVARYFSSAPRRPIGV